MPEEIVAMSFLEKITGEVNTLEFILEIINCCFVDFEPSNSIPGEFLFEQLQVSSFWWFIVCN